MSTRALNKVLSEVVDAERDRDRWVTALADAEAEAARALEADVTDPAELDVAGEHAARTASKVGAARRALARAEGRLGEARRAVLLVEAADEDAAGAAAARELTTLQGKVEALLGQLEAIDGVRYEPVTAESTYDQRRLTAGAPQVFAARRLDVISEQGRLHRIRAAVLRATAASGRVPGFFHELDERFSGVYGSSLIEPEAIPTSARTYVAGLGAEPVGVAAG